MAKCLRNATIEVQRVTNVHFLRRADVMQVACNREIKEQIDAMTANGKPEIKLLVGS